MFNHYTCLHDILLKNNLFFVLKKQYSNFKICFAIFVIEWGNDKIKSQRKDLDS